MRIRLITFCGGLDERFYIFDTEECKNYQIFYNTTKMNEDECDVDARLEIILNNDFEMRKDFDEVIEFSVDGEQIIFQGEFTAKYQCLKFAKKVHDEK